MLFNSAWYSAWLFRVTLIKLYMPDSKMLPTMIHCKTDKKCDAQKAYFFTCR